LIASVTSDESLNGAEAVNNNESSASSEVDKITQATSFGSTNNDVQPGALASTIVQSPSIIRRVRVLVAAQVSKVRRVVFVGIQRVKGVLMTTKHYTIDLVTALATRIMLRVKNTWNGFTEARLDAVKAMNSTSYVKDVTFSNPEYQRLPQSFLKEEWTEEDKQIAIRQFDQLKPSLLRRAIYSAQTIIRVLSLGYIGNKDNEVEQRQKLQN